MKNFFFFLISFLLRPLLCVYGVDRCVFEYEFITHTQTHMCVWVMYMWMWSHFHGNFILAIWIVMMTITVIHDIFLLFFFFSHFHFFFLLYYFLPSFFRLGRLSAHFDMYFLIPYHLSYGPFRMSVYQKLFVENLYESCVIYLRFVM